jgi:hypothetical protein
MRLWLPVAVDCADCVTFKCGQRELLLQRQGPHTNRVLHNAPHIVRHNKAEALAAEAEWIRKCVGFGFADVVLMS